jgi:thiamine biosynthesis lipoprotein
MTLARLFLIASGLLGPGLAWSEWLKVTEPIMGTRVHAEVWHEDAEAGRKVLDDVIREMKRIEAEYSPFIEESELSRLNREAGSGWIETTPEMIDLLQKSARVSELTGGAFDITYASVGRYYDYREGTRPDDDRLAEGLAAINYEFVELDLPRQRVRFTHPLVYIDLGGIAKGYAVDRSIALIEAAGIMAAAVAAGGDSRIIGDRLGEPWTVGVQDPRNDEEMAVLLPLVDTAVSTSGDYQRFFVEDGVRYHHILDPKTGDSARASWSVTILGPDATFTDAMSTSVFVLGPDRGLALIDRLPGIDAIVIDADGELRYSADLAELINPAAPR